LQLKKFIILGLLVLVTLLAVGCSDKEETEAEKTQRLLNER